MINEFLRRLWEFVKEIIAFGLDAFMIAAAREIGKRFAHRLKSRGGDTGGLEAPDNRKQIPVYSGSSGSRTLPFLDEYRD